MIGQYYEGLGRRKAATARVRLHIGGSGQIIVNDRPVSVYFPRLGDAGALVEPLRATDTETRFDI